MEKQTLGVMLQEARKEAGYSARKVCKRVEGMDPPGLSRVENSKCMPMNRQLMELCAIYGTEPETALKLVASEYGLKTPEKSKGQKGVPCIYKFTAAMSRDVARSLLAIVQAEGYATTQEWFAKIVKQKIAAGAGTPTTSAKKNTSSLL